MTTKVRMLGWSAKGLRCPDYSVSFERANGGIYPVSLIQMPNGTGKTTTLHLLRTVLSGAAEIEIWDAKKVRSYQKKRNPKSNGEFKVTLESNGQRVTLSLLFDFDEGTVKYSSTIGKGKDSGFRIPRECRDFFNPDFINFFIFDGELAHDLLNPDFTNAEKVIKCLYKLRHFNGIINVIDEYWKKTVEASKVSDVKGLTRRQNRVTLLSQRIDKLSKNRLKLENDLSKAKNDLALLTGKYEDKIREKDYYRKEYEQKRDLLDNAVKDVDILTQQLLKKVRSPHILSAFFAEDILSFKNNLDKVKLPESTAKEFFEELANEPFCVCGRPLDEEHRNIVRENAANYLGSEEMALLNNIKSEIAAQIGINPKEHEAEFKDLLEKYRKAIQNRIKAQTDLSAVEESLTEGDSDLQDAKNRIDDLKNQCQSISEEIRKFDDRDESQSDENTFGVDILKKRLEDAKQKLATITQTVEIKQKTEILKSILVRALSLSQSEIADTLKNEANDRIKILLPNNDIRILKVEKALYLEGQDAGSVGETLSVAYAFMATLFNNTERQLPFIVDSPANAIDLKVRVEVAQLIPKLTDQFIAFTISSEREGFIAPLEKACDGDVQYITLFRKGDISLEDQAKEYGKAEYTDDGIYVREREFFYKFHKDSEVEE